MSVVALYTDLGHTAWFAGELKGAILSLNPRAVPIDVTHSARGARDCAFALLASYRNFPEGAVFLAAADYGSVQTRVIAAKTASHIFIAPDNGVLSWMLRREPSAEIREVNTDEHLIPTGCATFPARDLLAPLAAALTDWLEFENCGRVTKDYVKLDWPEARADGERISTEIVYIDIFGNAVTSVYPRAVTETCGDNAVCVIDKTIIPVCSSYGDVPKGSPAAYPGSAGLMEIAVNGGSAAAALGIEIGSAAAFETV